MEDLIDFTKGELAKHPEQRAYILDLFELARGEIDDGGSEEHEIELMQGALEEEYRKQEVINAEKKGKV